MISYICTKIECVRSDRTCEACGRSTRVRLVGRPKNIVSDPACIYFAPRRVVRPNSISRFKDRPNAGFSTLNIDSRDCNPLLYNSGS